MYCSNWYAKAMRIDLRTRTEAAACPVAAHVVLDVPKPPLSPQQVATTAAKLAAVTAGLPKSARIEVFCAKGKRSGLAAAILRQAGFTNVVDLGAARCSYAAFAGTVSAEQRKALVEFIRDQRITDDVAFHTFAKSIGLDPDDAEPVAYQLAHDLSQQVRAHHVMFGIVISAAAIAGTAVAVQKRLA